MGEIDDRFLRHQNRTFFIDTKLIFDLLSILLFVFAAFSSHFIKQYNYDLT
jgi:accessory gene regulator protein AgrB